MRMYTNKHMRATHRVRSRKPHSAYARGLEEEEEKEKSRAGRLIIGSRKPTAAECREALSITRVDLYIPLNDTPGL